VSRTILRGGTIIDTRGGPASVGSVAFTDGHIVALGDVAAEAGDDVVDVSEKWILPGLFNLHAHLGWDGVHSLNTQAQDDSEIIAYRAMMNINRNLHAGVTTIRDLGMSSANVYARRAIDEGLAPPLRLFMNGRALAITGGHTWWCCRETDGVDDCRKAVREQVKVGATWIKIMGSHNLPQFTQAELDAIVDEAHYLGIKVTAHATFDAAIRRVLMAGVDCVEHGGDMGQETIDMFLKRGTWIVTTISPLILQAERGLDAGMHPDVVESRQRVVADPSWFAGDAAAAKAGVPIAFGTDAGSPCVPHDEIVPELKAMVDLGASENNLAALRAATLRAAELLGVDDRLGTIESGKLADIVVVGADPVVDLEAMRRVERVYTEGRLAFELGGHVWPQAGVNPPLRNEVTA
jgi:imidazolonepropionase-like amidohydrolase